MKDSRFDKITNSQITKGIAITIFIIIVVILAVLKAQSQEVRYCVEIDDGDYRNVQEIIFKSVDEVAAYYLKCTGHSLNTKKIFTGTSVWFQYKEGHKIFYCAKMKLITKRNGKKVLRAIKKKEVHRYNKIKY